MEPLDILLTEEGDPEAALRTQNAAGQGARHVLVDRGSSLIAQASLANVTNGGFSMEGGVATLLVFEFIFIGKGSHRFTSGHITIVFDDVSNDVRNRPVVWAISPSGSYAINKGSSTRDVTHGLNANLTAEVAGTGAGAGYTWEMSESQETHHSAKLVGLKRVFADGGKNNGVIWMLDEDPKKQEGIPTFLRAGVLLRRRADVPFRVTIEIESDVSFGGKLRRLFGLERPDPVDPVQLDEETDLNELGIATLDPEIPGLDLTNMKDMDVGKYSKVVLATLLDIPG